MIETEIIQLNHTFKRQHLSAALINYMNSSMVRPTCSSSSLCSGCDYTLSDFIELTNDDEEKMNKFLYEHAVISKTKSCPTCGNIMTLNETSKRFKCYRRFKTTNCHKKKIIKVCHRSVSQNVGTLFDQCHLSRVKICRLIAFWSVIPPPKIIFLCQEIGISRKTCIRWCGYFQEVCLYHLTENGTKLGGVNKVVEIDVRKIKKKTHKKNVESSWIFGCIQRGTRKCFLTPVPSVERETLLKVIKDNILPGTTIMSKLWESFESLNTEGFVHMTVDLNKHFVDPETGVHIQNIVRLWREVRSKVPRYGIHKEHLHWHLAEFMFKYIHCDNHFQIHDMFVAIANSYQYINVCESLRSHSEFTAGCKS